MNEYTIRQFNNDDRSLVEDFFCNMGGESRALFNRNSGNLNGALCFFEGKDKNVIRWMMLDNDKMIGYLFLWDLDKSIPWLGIAIADGYKGKNLGRKLMKKAEDYAVSMNKGGILLTTHVANLRGQGLYERMGYENMGMHKSGEVLYLLRFDKA